MAGTVTSTRIQIKKNDNALLFPRVRTVDIRDSSNEENIFVNDKLNINYLPIVQSTDVEAAGSPEYVPTESCMVDYVKGMMDQINSDITILTSAAGVVSVKGTNGITPTGAQTGAVTLSGVNTTGDGATVGVVATKEQALTTAAAYGLAAVEGNGGSKIVPTWNTFVNAIKAVSDAANTADHTHATTDTNGVHLIQNGSVWTAGANSATDGSFGTVQYATSVNALDTAFANTDWRAVDVRLLRRFMGALKVNHVYATEPSSPPSGNTDIYLVQSGDSAGIHWAHGGTKAELGAGIDTTLVYTTDGVAYVKNTGSTYDGTTPSGEDAYIPLVNRTSKGGLAITSKGTIYLTSNGDGVGTNLTPVTTLSTVVGATAAQKADVNMVPTVGAAAEISALAQAALDKANTASNNAGGKLARIYGSHGTSTADNSTIVGTDVKNLYHLHTGNTDAAVKNATFGVVQTIPNLKTNENVSDGNGLDVISALAVGTGKVYADGAAWETALQNNIVPTVAAIQGACLFYTEFED